MDITKEQFWKALQEPAKKTCQNCKYHALTCHDIVWHKKCDICINALYNEWEWDGKK